MYAIVDTGGKQYRVEPGAMLRVETLPGEVGKTVELKQVRLVHGETGIMVGRPWVEKATVSAEILRHGRTRSIMVFKKKRRKNYRRTKGHRQGFTEIRITNVTTV
jgi:large subunit ribosomal protein L21